MYTNQSMCARWTDSLFQYWNGVHQGAVLCPLFFLLYMLLSMFHDLDLGCHVVQWSGRVSVTGALSLHLWCIEFIDCDQFWYINLRCDYVGEYGFITNYVD